MDKANLNRLDIEHLSDDDEEDVIDIAALCRQFDDVRFLRKGGGYHAFRGGKALGLVLSFDVADKLRRNKVLTSGIDGEMMFLPYYELYPPSSTS